MVKKKVQRKVGEKERKKRKFRWMTGSILERPPNPRSSRDSIAARTEAPDLSRPYESSCLLSVWTARRQPEGEGDTREATMVI